MPISDLSPLPAIAAEIARLQPKSVLDLGVGFGLYGAVARQVLDATYGRCSKDKWKARIYGVEGFQDYVNPLWKVYDEVSYEDFAVGSTWRNFDLVLMIDSLEHLEPEAGAEFLDRIVNRNAHVIVSVPVQYMPQDAAFGNEFERHRTHYKGDEFERFSPTILYRGATQAMSIKGKA